MRQKSVFGAWTLTLVEGLMKILEKLVTSNLTLV